MCSYDGCESDDKYERMVNGMQLCEKHAKLAEFILEVLTESIKN